MRRTAPMLTLMLVGACHRQPASQPAQGIVEDGGFLVPAPPRPPPASACVRTSVGWFILPHVLDAGEAIDTGIEDQSIARDEFASPWWAAWTDTRTGNATLARTRTQTHSIPLGPGEHEGPLLVHTGAIPALVWVRQAGSVREHVVATGEELAARCTQHEDLDDSMAITAAGIHGGAGVLVAWDEDRPMERALPGVVAGAVLAQVVPSHDAEGTCPAGRVLSPQGQDAGDPLAVALPDGGVAVFWLASERVQSSDLHDNTTDIWGVPLDSEGAPRARPLQITTTPARRFGLAASVAGTTIWLAWRVAAESDNEGRGDGGDVVALSVDTHLTHAGNAVVLTTEDANPTGEPKVMADVRGTEVWWLDRRQEDTVTVRRTLEGNGALSATPMDEPMLSGELPVARSGVEVVTLSRVGGGLGVAHARCPWL